MVTIQLHNLILEGHHGVEDREREKGNTFEVNLDVVYEEGESEFERLEDTIDYAHLFAIVSEKIRKPGRLVEKPALEIIREIKRQYPIVREIKISIHKVQAPIENFLGKAGVTLTRKFER
jgi:dihydroneopterin aldolase